MRPLLLFFGLLSCSLLPVRAEGQPDSFTVDLRQGQHRAVVVDDAGLLGLAQEDGRYAAKGDLVSDVIERTAAGPLKAHWLERWTAPQTWTKFAKT